jgi:hypothetical protein
MKALPFFLSPLWLFTKCTLYYGGNSLGGQGDNKSSSSTTDASTHTTVTNENQQVGANEGSTAFGANSQINITNSDSAVVKGALDFGGTALASNNKSVEDALFFAAKSGSEANALVSKVLDKKPTPTNDNLALLQGVSSVVSANLASASKTVDTTGNKNLVVTISVVGAILAGLFFFKPAK